MIGFSSISVLMSRVLNLDAVHDNKAELRMCLLVSTRYVGGITLSPDVGAWMAFSGGGTMPTLLSGVASSASQARALSISIYYYLGR